MVKDQDIENTGYRLITNAGKNANFLEMNILLRKNTGIAVNADNQIERFSCRIIYEIRLSKENIWKNIDTKIGQPMEEIK